MKIELQRKLDEVLGPILCFLFWPFAPKNEKKKNNKHNFKKVLVIKFFGLGSILLITPLLKQIKKKFPQAKIYFLTFKNNFQICKLIPEVNEVFTLEAKTLLTFPLEFLSLLKKLRNEKFDLLIDLEFFANFSTLVSFFTNPKCSVGFESFKFWRQRFYTNSVVFDHGKHAIDNFSRTLEVVSQEKNLNKDLNLKIAGNDLEKAKNILKQNGLSSQNQFLVVYPTAGALCENRRWPKDHFLKLLKLILSYKKNLKIVFVGSKSESSSAQELIAGLGKVYQPRLINLSGKTSIPEVCALMKLAKLFIGSDSGPLHMAEAVGTPTVSFFGPETPALYGPIGENHAVFYADLPCSPCLNVYNSKRYVCQDNRCLKAIKPETVFKVVKKKYLA
ncbi:MAG: glycosyltransferase family 9 protein [Patescibacteria group bacterium]|nr:glycosyltransferase family 9 protein [Patescibacteria group bacterium]